MMKSFINESIPKKNKEFEKKKKQREKNSRLKTKQNKNQSEKEQNRKGKGTRQNLRISTWDIPVGYSVLTVVAHCLNPPMTNVAFR